MRSDVSYEMSKLWTYKLKTAVWTAEDVLDVYNIRAVCFFVDDREIPRRKKLDFYTNLVLDYPGSFVMPDGSETFLDMSVFETKGIDRWFQDWALKSRLGLTPKVRAEAIGRIAVLGTLADAYRPIPNLYDAIKQKTLDWQHPDDWEAMLQAGSTRQSA